MLFILSTKMTTERFLLKLCQRNGNLKSRPSWLVSKHCNDVDSSEAESSTKEDVQENVESSYSDLDSSADEAKRRKSAGKPKPTPSSLTVTKSSKKALKKSNKQNKSLSEEEMERFPFPR